MSEVPEGAIFRNLTAEADRDRLDVLEEIIRDGGSIGATPRYVLMSDPTGVPERMTAPPLTIQHVRALQAIIGAPAVPNQPYLREILANIESQVRGDTVLVKRCEIERAAKSLQAARTGQSQLVAYRAMEDTERELEGWLGSWEPISEHREDDAVVCPNCGCRWDNPADFSDGGETECGRCGAYFSTDLDYTTHVITRITRTPETQEKKR